MTPLRARLAAAAPGLDDATLDELERAALPLVWRKVSRDVSDLAIGGRLHLGYVVQGGGNWAIAADLPGPPRTLRDARYPTEAAAREALVAAVMEAIYGGKSNE